MCEGGSGLPWSPAWQSQLGKPGTQYRGDCPLPLLFSADSKSLITACDDMHSHLYDVEHGALIEAFSGGRCWGRVLWGCHAICHLYDVEHRVLIETSSGVGGLL